MENAERVHNFP